ncbi:hypothetical protein ACQP0C_25780 [Nocardia sp. CA-129566]
MTGTDGAHPPAPAPASEVGYPVARLIELRDQVNALGARLDAATAGRSDR